MKISIIVPVYNKEKYLENLLNDFMEQLFVDFECVLIDDGSTDNSGKICDGFSERDSRFKVFHLSNCGVSNARNFGMKVAEGKYITFVDSDDRLYPKYLQNLYECIEKNKVDFVISGLEKYWENSTEKVYIRAPFCGIKQKKNILREFAKIQKETGIFGFCVAKIFSRELIKDLEFNTDLSLAEDFDFYLQVYKKVETFYFDDKCYYRYLQNAENSSGMIEDDKINYFSQLEVLLQYKKFLENEGTYNGENKDIINTKISDYVYFTLFHSSKNSVDFQFREMKKMIENNTISYNGRRFSEKYLLYCFEKSQIALIKVYLILYRKIRKIWKK